MAEQGERIEAARLGRALQLLRVDRGMKRPELARRAELSYPYVSEIENGLKTPSTKALRQLAAALDCSPADLINLADRVGGVDVPRINSPLGNSLPASRDPERVALAHDVPSDHRGGPLAGTPSPSADFDELSDWRSQVQIAAIVRAELALWARTQLPELVRAEIKRALREH